MRLRGFGTVDVWDRIAAAQMLCVIMAIYKDLPQYVRTLIGSDASLVAYQPYSQKTWPPAYMVLRESASDWWIVWEGTTNLRQMGGHIWGAFVSPGGLPGNQGFPWAGMPNGAWLEVWRQQWPAIRALLPASLSGVRIRMSGHSYGAALAMMSASYLMRDEPAALVQLLTFGSPKVWTAGYSGPLPEVCWQLQSPNDPVTQVPPAVIGMHAIDVGAPVSLPTVALLRWSHHGRTEYLGPDGSDDPGAPQPARPADGFASGIIGEHSTRNYFARCRMSWERMGSPP